MPSKKLLCLVGFFLVLRAFSQQLPDTSYTFHIAQPAFAPEAGPQIWVDEGHNNFHVASRGLAPLKKLLKQDGFRVGQTTVTFDNLEKLSDCDILVIANPLHAQNTGGNWVLPNPSAFSEAEIITLTAWVKQGGNLLLVADHMPFGGAMENLGKAFGFEWLNGFAKIDEEFWPPSHFEGEVMLPESPIIQGLSESDRIQRVASFSGSAFRAPAGAIPVLRFLPEHQSLQPDTAWRFSDETPVVSLEEYCQGAILEFGKGKVAAWGEAGMLSAQVIMGDVRAGFNSAYAPENAQMVLNLMHWLAGIKEKQGPLTPDLNRPLTEDEQAILDINRRMEQALERGNTLAVSYFYHDDARLIATQQETHGREAIDAYWEPLRGRVINWDLTNEEIRVSGDMAWQRGISTLRYYNREGNEVESRVRFTLIWQKTRFGTWKIMVDHYSGY